MIQSDKHADLARMVANLHEIEAFAAQAIVTMGAEPGGNERAQRRPAGQLLAAIHDALLALRETSANLGVRPF